MVELKKEEAIINGRIERKKKKKQQPLMAKLKGKRT